MVSECKNMEIVSHLYEGHKDTCITSCLSGCMGKVYADDENNPKSAICVLGDFAFYAGKANREIVEFIPKGKQKGGFIIKVGNSPEWENVFKDVHKENIKLHERYMIKKDTVFDKSNLLTLIDGLDLAKYEIRQFDKEIYEYCLLNSWARDFVYHFGSAENYLEHGLGMGIMYDGELVAGASSYSYYPDGIEIEVVTREDFRQKGLATVACAALVLKCLEKGLYPSWDAANLNSVKLSKKLGYEFDYEYNSYEIIL